MLSDGSLRAVWHSERAVFIVKATATHSVEVLPFVFTAGLVTTPLGQIAAYDDRWCYGTVEAAVAAAWEWDCDRDAEPSGWHRHPDSGRRRPGGDPAREYIEM